MKAETSARAAMLENIRARNVGAGAAQFGDFERAYRKNASLTREACIALMIERLREYDAEVVECSPENLAETIAAQLVASGRKMFVAPAGLKPEWRSREVEWLVDRGLTQDEVEGAEGVVTACSGGVAESGTIVLHHGPEEGRRILTLLPDWHLCVLRASQIVETLPAYFARCGEPPRLATFVSGPSATADIEMTRIKGVHGPRFLHVVVVSDEASK